jgi:hypothetical protein
MQSRFATDSRFAGPLCSAEGVGDKSRLLTADVSGHSSKFSPKGPFLVARRPPTRREQRKADGLRQGESLLDAVGHKGDIESIYISCIVK